MYTLAFDFETSKVPYHMPYHPESYATLLCTRRSTGEERSWWFHHDEKMPCSRDDIKEIQAEFDGASRIIAHNLKFDLQWLKYIGINYYHLNVYCTMLAEYLICKQMPEVLKLSALCEKYNLPNKLDKVALYWKSGYETHEIPANILEEYCQRDVLSTHLLFYKQLKLIRQLELVPLVKLEMELIKSVTEIEINGLKVDIDLLKEASKDAEEKLKEIDTKLLEIIEYPINFGSNQQMSCALFGGTFKVDGTEEVRKVLKSGKERVYTRRCKKDVTLKGLGFEPPEDVGKTGYYSVGVDVIANLKAKTKKQKEVLRLLRERNRYSKLKSTYYDGFLEKEINGCIHPQINQTIAVTGRFTSSSPNGQNLPRGKDSKVKQAIISRF